MRNNTVSYARKIVCQLLKLQEGEDLCINTEQECLFLASQVKDEALQATHRPVTFVITHDGHPGALAPYDPLDYTLPQSKGRVMLHLQAPRGPLANVNDFDDAAQDMGMMLRFGHLADPVILDRRIAVPWCSVPCPAENDDDAWTQLLSAPGFLENGVHERHRDRCETLNNYDLRTLLIKGDGTDLTLALDESSHFTGNHCLLSSGRSFFSGLQTDLVCRNLHRSACEGHAVIKAMLLGNALQTTISVSGGLIMPDPMDYGQRLLKRFFLLEDNLDCLGSVTMGEEKLILTLGPNCLESLDSIPTSAQELPQWFLCNEFKLDLEIECDRIEGLTASGEKLLLRNHGTLLL